MARTLTLALSSLTVSLILAAAGADTQQAAAKTQAHGVAPATVSFRRDLIPLFRDSCTMCHQGDIPMGALDLTPEAAYDNLVGVQSANAPMLRVTPGRPDRSYLYYKTSGQNARIRGGGFGMPWGQALSSPQLGLLTRWIEQGAKNN